MRAVDFTYFLKSSNQATITKYCAVKILTRTRLSQVRMTILASGFPTIWKSKHRIECRWSIGFGHRIGMRYVGSNIITHFSLNYIQ